MVLYKFLLCNVDGKYLMRFKSETSNFKFLLRHIVGGRTDVSAMLPSSGEGSIAETSVR